MLFNLLQARITVLLCFFFLFRVVFYDFSIIPVVKENAKLKRVLAIPTGTPITLAIEAIETPPLVADKTIKALSKYINIFTHLLIYFYSLILIHVFQQ